MEVIKETASVREDHVDREGDPDKGVKLDPLALSDQQDLRFVTRVLCEIVLSSRMRQMNGVYVDRIRNTTQ